LKPSLCYRLLTAARHAGALRRSYGARLEIRRIAAERHGSGAIILSDNPYAGFFSLYLAAIAGFAVAQQNRQKLALDFGSGPYRDPVRPESTWWEYYFESAEYSTGEWRNCGIPARPLRQLDSLRDHGPLAHLGSRMARRTASSIAARFKPQAAILDSVNRFADEHFSGRFVLGLHYRGTDKVVGRYAEAGRVDYTLILQITESVLKMSPRTAVFVATDERELLDRLVAIGSGRILFTGATRSESDQPLHLQRGSALLASPYQLEKEALIDAMLLARTDHLLRTNSNLSLASALMNPRLESFNLSSLRSNRFGRHCSARPEDLLAVLAKKIFVKPRQPS